MIETARRTRFFETQKGNDTDRKQASEKFLFLGGNQNEKVSQQKNARSSNHHELHDGITGNRSTSLQSVWKEQSDYTVYGPFTIEGKHITVPVTLYDEPLTPVPTGVTLPYLPYVAALGLGVVVLVVIRRGKKKA